LQADWGLSTKWTPTVTACTQWKCRCGYRGLCGSYHKTVLQHKRIAQHLKWRGIDFEVTPLRQLLHEKYILTQFDNANIIKEWSQEHLKLFCSKLNEGSEI